ncbi:MAG TPA: hypothetical protein VGK67_01555 [Myxococcales bacterium]
MVVRGRGGRGALWLVGLWALMAGSVSRAQPPGPVPAQAEGAAELRGRLERLVQQTKTASWVQVRWERKGSEEQWVRSRCLWTAEGLLRMDVEDGYGAGTTLLREGNRVTIKPPGILGAFKLHKNVSDGILRSLRGKDLRTAGFLPELQKVLERWDEVDLQIRGTDALLRYADTDRLQGQMAIQLETLTPLSIETRENGEVVERTTFDQVRFGVPVDPDRMAP